ncbi:hypothetical protein ACFQ5N_06390 [Lutibacter holmesii]|uniref:Phage integrase SAM-like domain-containing protein n=1 Tax=Lutibacter holmesii TaxID=1137985 RepID=A0ABW3WN18_9FLAO
MNTPTIRYYLQNQNKQTVDQRIRREPIMVEINYGYVGLDGIGNKRAKPFRIALNASIEPVKFGKATENFKFDKEVFKKATRNNASIRTKMGRLQENIDLLVDRYVLSGIIPTPSEFKHDLLIELGRVKRKVLGEHKILDYLYSKIKKSEEESNMGKRSSIAPNTIKTYRTVSHLIENYQIATSSVITFENFGVKQYWEFWDVMDDILKDKIQINNPKQPRKQRKQDYGYLKTTLRKYQTTFVKTLKDAKEDSELNADFLLNVYDKNIILEKEEASKDVYVTEDEIKVIIKYDAGDDEDLQMAKEYMIIGSLTGMRFESMKDSKEAKVQVYNEGGYNFKYIHSKQNKTKTEIYIPLLEPVLNILEKYNNTLPAYGANPTINKHIKILFKKLKFDRSEDEVLRTYRSGEIRMKKPLHELITTHDCKKTFYTNLYNKQVNPTAIDNMTHPEATQKNRMAKIYNKANMLDKAKMFVDEINKIESSIYKF